MHEPVGSRPEAAPVTAAAGVEVEAQSARRLDGPWAALLGFAPVTALAAAQGGYFATSWGWASLSLLWISAVALVLGRGAGLARGELAYVGGWVAVACWIALSALWSADVPQTVLEVERSLVYVGGAVALVTFASSSAVPVLLGGLLCAIAGVSTFSLATRLFPGHLRVFDTTATYRLSQPLGYWNGLSIFAALGMILAFGFAARGRRIAVRAAAAALLPLLLATFYFTFGRTGWIALAVGVAAAVAVDRRRSQLLVLLLLLAPVLAAALALSAHYPGLTHRDSGLAQASTDGRHLAAILLGLAALGAVIAWAVAVAERRLEVPARARRAFTASVATLVLLVAAGALVHEGGPVRLAHRGWHAFNAPPPRPVDLNQRLLSFSGNGRSELWRIAWHDARSHPVLGSGAGTYERYFLQHQPADVGRVRDAHGLYVETLAELGPIGLALLVAALLTPLAVAVRRPRTPLTAIAVGAYAAFLVHAGSDWDWELPVITLVAVLLAGALVAGERRAGRTAGGRLRTPAIVAVGAAGVAAAFGLLGNSALGASDAALKSGSWAKAATEARRARTLMPWSPQPWAALGSAELGAGLADDARASYRKALSIDDGDWILWVDLARATRGAEQRRAVQRALALYPRAGFSVSPTGQIVGGDTTP